MSGLIRFGVSLEKNLLEKFDYFIKQQHYATRSKAISDLIRESVIKQEWAEGNREVAGAVMLVYDHHKRKLVNTLLQIQHDYYQVIVSSQHIHLDHHCCLEVIVVKGNGNPITGLVKMLKTIKGIRHVTLSMTATAETEEPDEEAAGIHRHPEENAPGQ